MFANEQCACFNRPWQLTLYQCCSVSVWKAKCVCVCKKSTSLHVSICVMVGVCGWAWCQPLSDSTPSCWRIFVSETNGTERINYRHNVGDTPELLGGGGENRPFPCTLHSHPPPPPPPCPSVSTNGRLELLTCPCSLFPSSGLCGSPQRDGTHPGPLPEKPESHPVISETQEPSIEAEKDTLWLGNTAPLHSFWTCRLSSYPH